MIKMHILETVIISNFPFSISKSIENIVYQGHMLLNMKREIYFLLIYFYDPNECPQTFHKTDI